MALTALLLAAAAAASVQPGALANPGIDELSGLTVSRRDTALLWGHNDGGDRPALYRIGLRGEDLGKVVLPDATNLDWEDIASFEDALGPALLIADTGDNFALNPTVTLYAVLDPGWSTEATQLWRLDFRYEDGARDCEAVAVDQAHREIVLVSKRDEPPRIYTLPLPDRQGASVQTARFEGTVHGLVPVTRQQRLRSPNASRFWQAPTALDFSADGHTAVLITPRNGYLWHRDADQRWAQVLQAPPQVLNLPLFQQTEAAALSADGHDLYVGSEGSPAPFAHVRLPR